jgi:hypothetical protein
MTFYIVQIAIDTSKVCSFTGLMEAVMIVLLMTHI